MKLRASRVYWEAHVLWSKSLRGQPYRNEEDICARGPPALLADTTQKRLPGSTSARTLFGGGRWNALNFVPVSLSGNQRQEYLSQQLNGHESDHINKIEIARENGKTV